MTPRAAQVAALEKYRGTYTRTIIVAEMLNIKNSSAYHFLFKFLFITFCLFKLSNQNCLIKL